jgi:hypothetical protein
MKLTGYRRLWLRIQGAGSNGRNLWMSPRMRARRTFHPDL